MKITATIIAYNEEKDIAGCIASAQQVCDEVIVIVDTKTTDSTAKIARAAGARVFHQEYLGDGPQKAWAVPHARHDWILSIDADERLDQDMVAYIRSINLNDDSVDAYAFRRRNFVGKHWIRAAGFYPDYVVRLYHRSRAGYLPRKAHSRVEAKKIHKVRAHLLHRTYENYSHWLERVNALSSRDAWAMYQKGKRPTKMAPVLHAFVAFLRKFFLKGGFLQGVDGLTVTLTTVLRAYFKYLKCIEMHEAAAVSPEVSEVSPQQDADNNPNEGGSIPRRRKVVTGRKKLLPSGKSEVKTKTSAPAKEYKKKTSL